ncbi:MAG: cell division protein FtsX [Thermodesulfovibrionales bacterium]
MITGYSFRFAFESLKKEFWINVIAALSAGVGLLLVAILSITFYSINSVAKKLPEKFTIILYMKDNTPSDEINKLLIDLKNNSMVRSARVITKDSALNELKKRLKDSSFLIEGLDANPLPDSVEIRLSSEAVEKTLLKDFIKELRSISYVDDIDYGEDVMESILMIKKTVETSGIAFMAIILTGILFNFYTTIKILFYRRKEEVETFKLLGASGGFIRAPFLIEGAAIGIAGGLVASLMVFGIAQVFALLSARLPFIASLNIQPYLLSSFMLLPLLGALLGITGAFLSIGRIRY